jgi:hypothetical protein
VNLVALCRRYGLPRPDQQVPRIDATGRQRYLDERVLRFPASALVNEPQQVAAQLQSALIAAGWRP